MDKELIAGVDEVGRGCLAGPVISASVILDKNKKIEGLKDSKLLSPKKRLFLYKEIKDKAISFGVGSCSPGFIDKVNIREATFSSMSKAIDNLSITPKKILVDGEGLDKVTIPNEGVIGGDNLIDCIKAASIIAKVTRDKLMIDYSSIFPEYDFQNNKGYGTQKHLAALKEYKSTPLHRNSFKPVKENKSSLKWIIENNKTNWLAKKLVGLYLNDNGHKILAMDYFDLKTNIVIDIISLLNKKVVFTEVFSNHSKNVKPNKSFFKDILLSSNKKNFEEVKNEFFPKFDYQIDRIYIKITNGPPEISRMESNYI